MKVDYEERARIREIRQRYYESLQAGTVAAENAPTAPPAAGSAEPPVKKDLGTLRAEYKELAGEAASMKWNEATLEKKLAELKAKDAEKQD